MERGHGKNGCKNKGNKLICLGFCLDILMMPAPAAVQ
jgi:hypothetical protein